MQQVAEGQEGVSKYQCYLSFQYSSLLSLPIQLLEKGSSDWKPVGGAIQELISSHLLPLAKKAEENCASE